MLRQQKFWGKREARNNQNSTTPFLIFRDSPARNNIIMQSEDLACLHERKRFIGENHGPLQKQSLAKPPIWNKGKKRRGGGLVFPVNYGRTN